VKCTALGTPGPCVPLDSFGRGGLGQDHGLQELPRISNFSMERSRSVGSFPKGASWRTLCCRLAVGRFLTIPISSFRTNAGKVVLSRPLKSKPVVFTGLKCVQCWEWSADLIFFPVLNLAIRCWSWGDRQAWTQWRSRSVLFWLMMQRYHLNSGIIFRSNFKVVLSWCQWGYPHCSCY
jgi:hypothetical protein